MPTTTGFSKNKWYNSGRMENKGWEARIDGVLYEKKDWRVSAYVNLSRNTNEITELPETMNPEPYTFKNGEYAIRIEEGRPFGSFSMVIVTKESTKIRRLLMHGIKREML